MHQPAGWVRRNGLRTGGTGNVRVRCQYVQKPPPYKCSICGAEVPNLPMPVLKHQLSHVRRRPAATGRLERPRERDKVNDAETRREQQ